LRDNPTFWSTSVGFLFSEEVGVGDDVVYLAVDS